MFTLIANHTEISFLVTGEIIASALVTAEIQIRRSMMGLSLSRSLDGKVAFPSRERSLVLQDQVPSLPAIRFPV